MGGHGSGRKKDWGNRSKIEDFRRLDVSYLSREGMLVPGSQQSIQWFIDGTVSGQIEIEAEVGRIVLSYHCERRSGSSGAYCVRDQSAANANGLERLRVENPCRTCGDPS